MRKRKVAVILFLVLLVGCGIAPDTGGNSFPASASAMEPPQSVSSYIEDVDVSSEMVDVWTQTRSTDECDFINVPDGAEKATLKV